MSKNTNKIKRKGDKRNTILLYILNLIFVLVVLLPFYWLLTTSLKSEMYITTNKFQFFPQALTLNNYKHVATYGEFGRIFINTVIVSMSTVILSIIVVVPAAYALAILKPKRGGLITRLILSLQMLPGILLIISLYIIMQKLGLIDTYASLILSYTTFTTPFCFLLLASYYQALPMSLFESAYIDGCNSFTSMIKIALPLTAPGLITTASYSFINAWNDFLFSNTFTSTSDTRTLTAEVVRLVGSWGTRWGYLTAGATLAILPVILVFLFANKYIIAGLTAGSVKG